MKVFNEVFIFFFWGRNAVTSSPVTSFITTVCLKVTGLQALGFDFSLIVRKYYPPGPSQNALKMADWKGKKVKNFTESAFARKSFSLYFSQAVFRWRNKSPPIWFMYPEKNPFPFQNIGETVAALQLSLLVLVAILRGQLFSWPSGCLDICRERRWFHEVFLWLSCRALLS